MVWHRTSGREEKKLQLTRWIALASASAAIIATLISASSVNVAKAQNIAAEQQQLVTITIAIEQDQAAGNRTGTARSAAVAG
jgi:hypothetical protein